MATYLSPTYPKVLRGRERTSTGPGDFPAVSVQGGILGPVLPSTNLFGSFLFAQTDCTISCDPGWTCVKDHCECNGTICGRSCCHEGEDCDFGSCYPHPKSGPNKVTTGGVQHGEPSHEGSPRSSSHSSSGGVGGDGSADISEGGSHECPRCMYWEWRVRNCLPDPAYVPCGSTCCDPGIPCCNGSCCKVGEDCFNGHCRTHWCGSGGINVPDFDSTSDWSHCCRAHDHCYDTCGFPKAGCDEALRVCMANAGASVTGDAYWLGVQSPQGIDAYNAAQAAACPPPPPPPPPSGGGGTGGVGGGGGTQ